MGVNSIMNDAGRIGFVIKGDYSNTETYDFLDIAYFNGATYVAKKLTVGNTPDNTEFWHILADGNIDVNDIAPTFLQAKTRENINSGEKLPVLFGKIKKWYTDLKAVAFSGSYNDLSDTPSIPAAVAVKGNAESSYRTGNVNLTPANIGAMPTANVLDSKESITANTASGNVAGALGTKEINANLQSQIDTLNSNLNNAYLVRTNSISLVANGNDSPEYKLQNSSYTSCNDIYNNNLRWYTVDGSSNIKYPLKLDLSNDTGYIFGNQIATMNKINILNSFDSKKWNDSGNIAGGFGMFYYEGHDTTDYDIPSPYCMVLVCKQSTARGVAIAIRWNTASSTSRPMWINTLWDNWKGWVQVIE